jgi:glycosyltransferase involved in cell wall biosynthesis
MRLLYLVDHWPGLFEAYLLREMQWMRQRGHSVAVLSLGVAGPHGFRNETRDHVDLAQFGVNDVPVLQLDSRSMGHARTMHEAAAFVRKCQAELIDAHLAREPAEAACDLHHESGIPFCVRMRGGDVHTNTSPRLAEIVHYASAICPMSQFLADTLVGRRVLGKAPPGIPVKVSPAKLHVVPGCLPTSYLAVRPVAQNDNVQVIGAVGRAVSIKRFPDIIQAVAGLAPDFPGLKLQIVGGGVLLPELREIAAGMGLGDRFEITGFRKWDEVIQLACRFHIYVHSSELEGFGMSTIEAAFQGLPLALSRTGAHEQCVEPGVNGYLFDPGDVVALRESLRALLLAGAGKRELMGRASLEMMGRQFTAERVMPQIEAIFRNIITHRAETARGKEFTGSSQGIPSHVHD